MKKGSLVVNSSQGGGSKDTWVLAQTAEELERAERESEAATNQENLHEVAKSDSEVAV